LKNVFFAEGRSFLTPQVVCICLTFTMVLLNVIPAKAGIQVKKTGFRIKPALESCNRGSGMTEVANGLLRHYTSGVVNEHEKRV
jgi:hypothetical protein